MVKLAKIALRNLKNSFKDYAIYFLTIAFGVCIFYVFNSVDCQQSMIQLKGESAKSFKTIVNVMDKISIIVAITLAFLIVYANKFLIKRRNKELSIYMILGMNKRKISSLLVLETFFTGIFALGIGLVAGILVSQGLAVIVANIFRIELESFKFKFSSSAFGKTIFYFAITFLIVMLFNVINVTQSKLIDLMYSEKKNESHKVKSIPLSIVFFVISLGCIGFSYYEILKGSGEKAILLSGIFCIVGTFLLFYSLSGILPVIFRKSKKLFYKNLNIFTLRQFSNKINTNCISMTVISVMLMLSTGLITMALSTNYLANQSIDKANPQDATFICDRFVNPNMKDAQKTDTNYPDTSEFSKQVEKYVDNQITVNVYKTKYNYNNIFSYFKMYSDENVEDTRNFSTYSDDPTEQLTYITLSDYNKMMKMRGKEEISLNENEYVIDYCDYTSQEKKYNPGTMPEITIKGKKLRFNNKIVNEQIENSEVPYACTIIVSDKFADKQNIKAQYLLCNLKNQKKECEIFSKIADKYSDEHFEKFDPKKNPSVFFYSAYTIRDGINESFVDIMHEIFVLIYVGIIFLITSCAILSLQQLTESNDNAFRYQLLEKIGADKKSINKALFRQIGIYFALPLIVAIIHVIVGMKSISSDLSTSFTVSLCIIGLMILFYCIYLFATYFCSKNMIKGNVKNPL